MSRPVGEGWEHQQTHLLSTSIFKKTVEFTLYDMMKVYYDIHGVKLWAYQHRILSRLDLTPVVYGNAIFSPTINAMSQVYSSLKLDVIHLFGYHWSYSHSQIDRTSWLLWKSTNNKATQETFIMVYMDNRGSIKVLMVIWTAMARWSPLAISGPHWGQHHGTTKLCSFDAMTPTMTPIHLISFHLTSSSHSSWRQETGKITSLIKTAQMLPFKQCMKRNNIIG